MASMKTCVVLDDALSNYHFGARHPFGPLRYAAFLEEFERRRLRKDVVITTPRSSNDDELGWFHTREYISEVRERSLSGRGFLDTGDTPAIRGIYEAASIVVGATLTAVEQVMQGPCCRAFVPIAGLHHARRDQAAGFCVFNDCGVAIELLRRRYGIQRIAYIDIDAHHGDGVFYAYESDPEFYFVDFHEDGRYLYPGTGAADEKGIGDGEGKKLNIPLAPNTTDSVAFEKWPLAETMLRAAKPQFYFLQCGADSLAGDPITHLNLSSDFHRRVAKSVVALAEETAHGRVVAMGGGGYDLKNIASAWTAVVDSFIEVK